MNTVSRVPVSRKYFLFAFFDISQSSKTIRDKLDMESQGSTQAAPLPSKEGQATVMAAQATGAPGPGPGPGPAPGQMYYPPQQQPGLYPTGQPPPAYTTVPQVQYIIQNPQPMANPPKDYFVEAILVTIFCFWPTGIIAIIKALESRKAAQMGNTQLATLSSQAARKMSLISLLVGIAILAVVIIIIIIEVVVVLSL